MFSLVGVWEQLHNTLIASQHLPCHHCELEPHSDIAQHFSKNPNLRAPRTYEEWIIELEPRPTIVTQACVSLTGGTGSTLITSQHLPSRHYVLEPLRDCQAFQNKPNMRGLLMGGEWFVEVEPRPAIVTQAHWPQACGSHTGGMGIVSQHSHSITIPSIIHVINRH